MSFEQVVDAIGDLGFESFVLLDRAEPEFKAFASLLSKQVKPELAALLGVSTGLVDYQLGEGGATRLWQELERIASGVTLRRTDDAKRCMELLLQSRVCAMYKDQKVERINRLFSSPVPAYIVEHFTESVHEPSELWGRIAEAVRSAPEKKTITFAMKAFDLAVFCSSDNYLEFKEEPPIAVDFHVRGIGEILGLVPSGASDDEIRHLWFRVSDAASKKTTQKISPLRIDSLIWQTGVLTYDPMVRKHSKSRLQELEEHLTGIGIESIKAHAFLELLRSGSFPP